MICSGILLPASCSFNVDFFENYGISSKIGQCHQFHEWEFHVVQFHQRSQLTFQKYVVQPPSGWLFVTYDLAAEVLCLSWDKPITKTLLDICCTQLDMTGMYWFICDIYGMHKPLYNQDVWYFFRMYSKKLDTQFTIGWGRPFSMIAYRPLNNPWIYLFVFFSIL